MLLKGKETSTGTRCSAFFIISLSWCKDLQRCNAHMNTLHCTGRTSEEFSGLNFCGWADDSQMAHSHTFIKVRGQFTSKAKKKPRFVPRQLSAILPSFASLPPSIIIHSPKIEHITVGFKFQFWPLLATQPNSKLGLFISKLEGCGGIVVFRNTIPS